MNIKPIKSEADYEATLTAIDGLMGGGPDTPEGDELQVLVTLVEAYEAERWLIEAPDPISAIEHVMESRGFQQKDLAVLIGSQPDASEILTRRRPLTLPMIRVLSANGTFQPIYLSASTTSRPRHRSALLHGSLFALGEPSSQESTGPKISGQAIVTVPTHERIGPKTDPGETARQVARSGSTEDSRPRSVMSAWTKTNPLSLPDHQHPFVRFSTAPAEIGTSVAGAGLEDAFDFHSGHRNASSIGLSNPAHTPPTHRPDRSEEAASEEPRNPLRYPVDESWLGVVGLGARNFEAVRQRVSIEPPAASTFTGASPCPAVASHRRSTAAPASQPSVTKPSPIAARRLYASTLPKHRLSCPTVNVL